MTDALIIAAALGYLIDGPTGAAHGVIWTAVGMTLIGLIGGLWAAWRLS